MRASGTNTFPIGIIQPKMGRPRWLSAFDEPFGGCSELATGQTGVTKYRRNIQRGDK